MSAMRPATAVRGFSLLEVLLAMVLLSAGLALGFATLRAATATTQRGEQLSQRSERMRAASGFLHRRIVSALPIPFHLDPMAGEARQFAGTATQMQFVADLPDYLGRGGPHLHTLAVHDAGQAGLQLTVAFATTVAGKTFPQPGDPEVLADGLKSVHFRYRSLDESSNLGEWQDEWPRSNELPLQVRIDIESREGPWPPLLITLNQVGQSGLNRDN